MAPRTETACNEQDRRTLSAHAETPMRPELGTRTLSWDDSSSLTMEEWLLGLIEEALKPGGRHQFDRLRLAGLGRSSRTAHPLPLIPVGSSSPLAPYGVKFGLNVEPFVSLRKEIAA